MKKVISLFLSLAMLLSIVSVVDFSAYADALTTGKCGVNVTYSFDTSTGMLTISGTGKMTDYSYQNYSPFYQNTNIESVSIEDGVTSIGESAFDSCTSLTSVTIPDSVTSIGDRAFERCYNLTSVTIPDSVTSIGGYAFYSCDNLTSITIPNSVTSIGESAFDGTAYYNDISNWENNEVLYIGNHLIKVKTTIRGDYSIKENTICIADSAFGGCDNLTSVTIPNGVTSIGVCAFSECYITSVTIGNGVTSIGGYAFYSCDNLTSVTIPNSVTSIGDHAFGYNFADERVKGFTIYGTLGTEAERYANDNGFTFMDVASKPSEPSTEPTTQPTTQPTPQPSVPATQPEQTTQAQSKPAQKSKSTKIKKVKGSKKAIAVQWVKTKGVKGYQVQVATDKKFKKNKKTVTIKKQKTTKTTVKKLKAKKKYYVRIRTYKIVNGKRDYSSWSKVKSVKTK